MDKTQMKDVTDEWLREATVEKGANWLLLRGADGKNLYFTPSPDYHRASSPLPPDEFKIERRSNTFSIFQEQKPRPFILGDKVHIEALAPKREERHGSKKGSTGVIVASAGEGTNLQVLLFNPAWSNGESGKGWSYNKGRPVPGFPVSHAFLFLHSGDRIVHVD